MSAETLREAAKVLRERAAIVERAPWSVTHIDSKIIPGTRDGQDEWFVMGCFDGVQSNQCGPFAACDWEPSATYIATMHPGVGLALADWLDSEFGHDFGPSEHAITVARLILGEAGR